MLLFNKIFTFFLCLILWGTVEAASQTAAKLKLQFFGSTTCGECLQIKEELLKPLGRTYSESLQIDFYDIESQKDFAMLVNLEKQNKIQNPCPQELFFPDTFLCGFESIMQEGSALIKKHLSDRSLWGGETKIKVVAKESYREILTKRFQQFTFLGIFAAGLIDGVNPCAIATMIFLISFLAVKKYSRKEILAVGLCFTLSVFVTYLLLGVGAFRVLTLLKSYYWISKVIKWSAVTFAGVVSLLSFKDAFSYQKSGETESIKLQLPKVIKLRIHKVISANLSGRQIAVGALVTGFLVTLLEAVCTGQVYLPTIVLMTRENGLRLKGWLYLIFYNFLFVLPLLIIMVLAYFGLTWDRLSKMTKKHLTLIKILLGIVMLALALFLAFSM